MRRSVACGIACLVVLIMLIGVGRTEAQETVEIRVKFQYAVAFTCGNASGAGPIDPGPIHGGNYRTGITVHNPSFDHEVIFAKKVAIALPDQQPGTVSAFEMASLGPSEAFDIGCSDIERLSGITPFSFARGYVVIATPVAHQV